MILAIRCDTAVATLALLDPQGKLVDQISWEAGRQLSQQLLPAIEKLIAKQKHTLEDLTGLIVFPGPGSFTSLRITITTANTLAYALNIPVVGAMSDGWIAVGLENLKTAKPAQIVMPEYGSEARVTTPRK